jgi:hypothetical protein
MRAILVITWDLLRLAAWSIKESMWRMAGREIKRCSAFHTRFHVPGPIGHGLRRLCRYANRLWDSRENRSLDVSYPVSRRITPCCGDRE